MRFTSKRKNLVIIKFQTFHLNSTGLRKMIYLWHTKNGFIVPQGRGLRLSWVLRLRFGWVHIRYESISGMCHLLGNSPILWHCKKQTGVTLSTTEAKYIVAGSCCAQFIWMEQQLSDDSVNLGVVPI